RPQTRRQMSSDEALTIAWSALDKRSRLEINLPVAAPESPTLRSLRAIHSDTLLRGFGKLLRFGFGSGNAMRNWSSQAGFFALLFRRIRRSSSGLLFSKLGGVGESRKGVHRHTQRRGGRRVGGCGRSGRGYSCNRGRDNGRLYLWRRWNRWRDRRSGRTRRRY